MDTLYDVVGYEGRYKINKNGEIWSCLSKKFMSAPLTGRDINSLYKRLALTKKDENRKSFYIHQLLGKNFIPNPNNYTEIDHIDGNKTNNALENLRWCSSNLNQQNKPKMAANKSGYKNISSHTNKAGNEYWIIKIQYNMTLFHKLYNKKDFTLEQVIAIRDDLYIEFGLEKYD
jgi:hypothetical protein